MTRKDYELIATAVRASRGHSTAEYTLERVAINLADSLIIDNPRFDRARFLRACGIEANDA